MAREPCPICYSNTALGSNHCFKCGYVRRTQSYTDGYLRAAHSNMRDQIIELRKDVEFNPNNFPPDAIKWLYSAGLYNDTIIKQGIGYCKDINKVLIPAYSDKLEFYQLRSLDGTEPKYTTVGKMGTYRIMYADHANNRIVVCEDHLSAIRLRKHMNVLCLSGTSIASKALAGLIQDYTEFTLWLDADEAGQVAAAKFRKNFQSCVDTLYRKYLFLGKSWVDRKLTQVDAALYRKDPKSYTDSEITCILTAGVKRR